MEIERLKKTLKASKEIKNLRRFGYESEYSFERLFEFTVRDVKYKIEWYTNVSTLYIGELEVLFTRVEFESTWPSYYKNFLQFYDCRDRIVAVLPLEKYEGDK